MPTCSKCNSEVKEGDKFCPYCGASLTLEALKPVEKRRHIRERDTCFGEGERDYLGLVSFGFFLLAVGITYTLNPNVISDFRFWVDQLRINQTLVEPPEGLVFSATIFFGIIGVFDFAKAGIRLATNDIKRRVVANVFSGIALISFAYLIHLYGIGVLTWQTAVGTEIIICGLLVALYSIIRSLLRKR